MRQSILRLLIASVLGLAATSARAADEALAAWQAARRADAAQQALSDRYTAIWATLDTRQKSQFSAQERAWLNVGRQQEQQACLDQFRIRTEASARGCEAEVIERHLDSLGQPRGPAPSK
jgi:hypothetical protein